MALHCMCCAEGCTCVYALAKQGGSDFWHTWKMGLAVGTGAFVPCSRARMKASRHSCLCTHTAEAGATKHHIAVFYSMLCTNED